MPCKIAPHGFVTEPQSEDAEPFGATNTPRSASGASGTQLGLGGVVVPPAPAADVVPPLPAARDPELPLPAAGAPPLPAEGGAGFGSGGGLPAVPFVASLSDGPLSLSSPPSFGGGSCADPSLPWIAFQSLPSG